MNDFFVYMDRPDIALYHKDCPDGLAAAWIVKHRWNCPTIGVSHGKPPPNLDGYRIIMIMDFCYPRATLLELVAQGKQLIILDHHLSSQRDLTEPIPGTLAIFDMERSGCQIVWDYAMGGRRPWFIDIIADRDLWTWRLPNSKALSKGLFVDGYVGNTNVEASLVKLEELYTDACGPNVLYNKLRELGEAGLLADERSMAPIIAYACMADMHSPEGTVYKVKLYTANYLVSEIGNRLMEVGDIDISVGWRFDPVTDLFCLSLRSLPGKVDLSHLATLYSGGGHPCAAGCSITREDWPKVFTNIKKVSAPVVPN